MQTDAGMVEIMDSPGLDTFDQERPMLRHIISESDIIFFVIDYNVWFTAKEQTIHEYLMNNGLAHKTTLIVNKLDDKTHHIELFADYYAHGYQDVIGVSAKEGENIEALRELITYQLHNAPQKKQTQDRPWWLPLAILGKPNAGKSTLLNTLAKKDIAKVEDKAGTTMDYNMTHVTYKNNDYVLYDTAGLRKKTQMEEIESIAYSKTRRMLKYVRPLVIYLIDVTQWLSHRDKTIIDEVERLILPIIICLNKVDTISPAERDFRIKELVTHLPHLRFVPILPLSGQKGDWLTSLFRFVHDVRDHSHREIKTSALNKLFRQAVITRPPRFPKNRECKILYVTQTESHPPKFTLFISHKDRITSAFRQWVENTIRQEYGFIGTSIMLDFRERNTTKQHSQHSTNNDYTDYHDHQEYENILKAEREQQEQSDDNHTGENQQENE